MMTPYLMVRDSDGLIAGCMVHANVDAGPVKPQQPAPPGFTLVPDTESFTRAGRRESEQAYWRGDAVEWVEEATAMLALAGVIAAIDASADAARLMAIGDPARALEYQRAEFQARAYAAASYTGTVPRCVKAWADPKGWTGQQAADDIIATAERWYEALDTIRELRLAAKEAARAIAGDPEGQASAIYAVKTTFLTKLHTLMQGLA